MWTQKVVSDVSQVVAVHRDLAEDRLEHRTVSLHQLLEFRWISRVKELQVYL